MLLTAVLLLQYRHAPFAEYELRHVDGFRVYVSPALRAEPNLLTPALATLKDGLDKVLKVVPAPALKTLRTIPVFMENANPDFPCACYHTSDDWLKEHGYILAKKRSVEICNPKNFVEWVKQQPYMILHELSHGYHDIRFGYDDPYIESCLKNVRAMGIYESVERYNGRKQKHYALTNQQEYFAETTEAFFGRNDYWPFDRAQLAQCDPKGLSMMRWAWGAR